MEMELTKGQIEGINTIVKRYKQGRKTTVITGGPGYGKAQPVNTVIPTPNGNKKLGDLKIGDYVFDRMGKPTKITGIYPQGMMDNYKVTFEDGRFSFCNDEHLWSYYTSKGNLATKSLKEMLQANIVKIDKNGHKHNKFQIPVQEAIELEEKVYDVHPYTMGVFLGDGCCLQRQLTLSSENDEIPKYIMELENFKNLNKSSDTNFNWTFELPDDEKYLNQNESAMVEKVQTKKFFSKYVEEVCQYSYNKRIPEEYKKGSIQQRYDLLQGLFDTDGTIASKDNHRYNMKLTSTSLGLLQDVQEIVLSLGYKKPTINEDKRSTKYTDKCYNLLLNIANEEKYKFFRLKRKKEIALEAKNYPKRKNYKRMSIVNVEQMPEQVEMVCIMVDNKEHLYLTNDFIVTHNTTMVNYAVQALKRECGLRDDDFVFAAFTGKATQVLSRKGNKNVSTLHKLLYKAVIQPDGTYRFDPLPAIQYEVVVVDECSMVPPEMVELLMSHHAYLIFCGDKDQLGPVKAEDDNHLLDTPDVTLTEVMRHQQDSEIIQVLEKIKKGEPLKPFKGKEVQIITADELSTGMYMWADQILCSTNATRRVINNEVRRIMGRNPDMPEDGDKVICTKNYWSTLSLQEEPLINGTIGYLNHSYLSSMYIPRWLKPETNTLDLITSGIKIPDTDDFFASVNMDIKLLTEGEECLPRTKKYSLEKNPKFMKKCPKNFEYGYAITCHKAQGSEYDKVLVIEEGFPYKKDEHKRWLYTACSRAKERLVLVLK